MPPPDERLLELTKTLAWIEQQLQEPIRLPDRPVFTQDDLGDLDIVRSPSTKGRLPASQVGFTLQTNPQEHERIIDLLDRPASHLRFDRP